MQRNVFRLKDFSWVDVLRVCVQEIDLGHCNQENVYVDCSKKVRPFDKYENQSLLWKRSRLEVTKQIFIRTKEQKYWLLQLKSRSPKLKVNKASRLFRFETQGQGTLKDIWFVLDKYGLLGLNALNPWWTSFFSLPKSILQLKSCTSKHAKNFVTVSFSLYISQDLKPQSKG